MSSLTTYYRILSTSRSMPGATFCSQPIHDLEEVKKVIDLISKYPTGNIHEANLLQFHFGSAIPCITGLNCGTTEVLKCVNE